MTTHNISVDTNTSFSTWFGIAMCILFFSVSCEGPECNDISTPHCLGIKWEWVKAEFFKGYE